MPFSLPKLPYAYDALEPYIDARTMEIHYTGHHQAYINNVNAALEKFPALQTKTVEQLLTDLNAIPEEIRVAVRNNGGGHYNHTLFWQMMKPNSEKKPVGTISTAIDKKFGSFATMQEQFNAAAKTVFGSGWAWLVLNKQGDLAVEKTANQDSPISTGSRVLLGLDVWEHAYYLKYQNKRPDYITAWWSVVNWEFVETLFKQ
ncbi:MAG: superoxide dismutase [Candidatus Babeliales bacterium]